jgi:hypothetical protein
MLPEANHLALIQVLIMPQNENLYSYNQYYSREHSGKKFNKEATIYNVTLLYCIHALHLKQRVLQFDEIARLS